LRLLNRGLSAGWLLLAAACTGRHLGVEKGVLPRPGIDEAESDIVPGVPEPSETAVRAAVGKAHAVLWKGIEGHAAHRSCFTCHTHGAPMLAFATARGRGFAVPEKELADLIEFSTAYFESNREGFVRGRGPGPLGLGGATDTTGWGLFALSAAGKEPDETTAAVVEYTLQRDHDCDHWTTWGPSRPPAEGSAFMPTALAIHGLQAFGLPEHRERIAERVEAARGWLLKTPAQDTEDRVFRLLGLRAAGAPAKDVRRAAEDLARTQRPDGGWGQTDEAASDAYATGSALAVLHMSGDMPVTDPVYRRGVAYLLRTQLDDGSWRVRSHSFPVQPYYESGFPHGRSQFISAAATGWAATALALACPLVSPSTRLAGSPDEVPHRPGSVRHPDAADRE